MKKLFAIFFALVAWLFAPAQSAAIRPTTLPVLDALRLFQYSQKSDEMKNADFWILLSSPKEEIVICANADGSIKATKHSGRCGLVKEIKPIKNFETLSGFANTAVLKAADFCWTGAEPPKVAMGTKDDFGVLRLCGFQDSEFAAKLAEDIFEKGEISEGQISEMKKFLGQASFEKPELKKFLKEVLGVNENVDFDAMFDEIKTYGGFGGLCNQLSLYLWENKKCPELYKFGTKQIHSCDGFYLIVKDRAIYCPGMRDLNKIKAEHYKNGAPVFLTHDFAVEDAETFLKRRINHPIFY